MAKNFVFTGGGTGGHVAPALAIGEGIRKNHPDAHFLYVGVQGKAEESMVPKAWAEDRNSLIGLRATEEASHRYKSTFSSAVLPKACGVMRSHFVLQCSACGSAPFFPKSKN